MIAITGSFLDAWFEPFTSYNATWIIFWFSLVLSFLSIIIYKYTTNQKVLKGLKERMNKIQKRMRELQKNIKDKEAQKEISKLNSKLMKISAEQMKHSMKSTLFTLIPFLLLFGWLSAHYTYSPLYPNQSFNVTLTSMNDIKNITLETPTNLTLVNESTQQVAMNNNIQNIYYVRTFTLRGPDGRYTLNFNKGNRTVVIKDILITTRNDYTKPKENYKDEGITLLISNKPLRINFLGLNLSWFWYYFIIMMIFSMIFRKMLKVY